MDGRSRGSASRQSSWHLIVVVGAFFSPRVAELWDITHSILGDVAVNTAVVAGGVGVCTLILGTALAGLVTFYDFPVGGGSTGRSSYRWRSRRTFSFVYLGRLGPESELPLRSPGCGRDAQPGDLSVRLRAGQGTARGQSRNLIEAARSLGARRSRAIARVALPPARPARRCPAGEHGRRLPTSARFSLGVKTFTVAIYQVWFGAFDRLAASQLASFLMLITLLILFAERSMRGRQRYAQSDAGPPLERVRLHGLAGWVAAAFPVLVVAIAFAGPLAQLLSWAIDSWDDPLVRDGFGTWARNSLMLGTIAALIVVPTALVLVYGLRLAPSRLNRVTARLATIGYGVPGSVVAVGVLLSLAWVDHRIQDLGEVARVSIGPLHRLGPRHGVRVRRPLSRSAWLEAQMARLSRPRRRRSRGSAPTVSR